MNYKMNSNRYFDKKTNLGSLEHLSSSPSDHEIRPINDLFRPHGCIRLVVSLNIPQVIFLQINIQGIFWYLMSSIQLANWLTDWLTDWLYGAENFWRL
jgi:hypothetical protein